MIQPHVFENSDACELENGPGREVLEAMQAECERIARELHDAAGQELAAAGLFAAGLQKLVTRAIRRPQQHKAQHQTFDHNNGDGEFRLGDVWFDNEETIQLQETIAGLRRGLAAAARSLRDISHGLLLTELEPCELPAQLEELRGTLEIARGVRCEVRCMQPGDPGFEYLSSERALQLLRIVQEAVSNALRHGGADQIRVSLTGNDRYIELEVADNGCGIANDCNGHFEQNKHRESCKHNGFSVGQRDSASALPPIARSGIGLRNMAYRARRIGGLLHVNFCSDGGTVVRCRVERGAVEHG